MNTCETCAHWSEEQEYQHHDVRECSYVVMLWDSHEWDESDNRVLRPQFKDQKAFVQDASDYRASLYTKREFGCNQWKAREQEKK